MMISGCNSKKEKATTDSSKGLWPDSVYLNAGNRIATATFDTLRKSLINAIGKRGTEGAIDLCHTDVIALTNAYADTVIIKRAAPKFRNPANKPDSLELAVFEQMSQVMQATGNPEPVLYKDTFSGQVHYFKPIILQALCINCHGAPQQDIQPSTMLAIREKYPNDQAVNFKGGELRAVWHILFKPVSKPTGAK